MFFFLKLGRKMQKTHNPTEEEEKESQESEERKSNYNIEAKLK